MKAVKSLLLLGLSLLPQLLWAQEWVDGTIRRIDTSGQKMTIKHEEIKELLMPPMTMVFRLKDSRSQYAIWRLLLQRAIRHT